MAEQTRQPIGCGREEACRYLGVKDSQLDYLHDLKMLTTVLPGVYLYDMLDEAAEQLRVRALKKLTPSVTLEIHSHETEEEADRVPSEGEGEPLEGLRDRADFPSTASVLRNLKGRGRKGS